MFSPPFPLQIARGNCHTQGPAWQAGGPCSALERTRGTHNKVEPGRAGGGTSSFRNSLHLLWSVGSEKGIRRAWPFVCVGPTAGPALQPGLQCSHQGHRAGEHELNGDPGSQKTQILSVGQVCGVPGTQMPARTTYSEMTAQGLP